MQSRRDLKFQSGRSKRGRTQKRGHYEKGLLCERINQIVRIDREWPICPYFLNSVDFLESFKKSQSRTSGKGTFRKKTLFQETDILRRRFFLNGPNWLGCQSWQSRVADFLFLLGRFSKRTFLTKSVVWNGAQQTLSLPPAAAEGLQVHFNIGASTMCRKQPKGVPESMLWCRLQEWAFSIDLTGGFVGRFCSGFLGLAGGFRGAHAGGFFVRGWRIFRRIFSAEFSLVFCDQNNQLQNSTEKCFHSRLKPDRPWANSKFSTGSLKVESGLSAHFFATSKELLEHGNRSSGIPRRASFKPHIKWKNQKLPRKSSLLKSWESRWGGSRKGVFK